MALALGTAVAGSELLRFCAVGSADDGKSTLVGRLLHDTQQLFDDQLDALSTSSRGSDGGIDLALVTDGLRAEREQGITDDVAYRYASTPSRCFVIADCPGHVQHTRNMATSASTADVAVVVVDVTAGLREQARRHTCIAALFGVRRLVVAVNKMDLVGWSDDAYLSVHEEFARLAPLLDIASLTSVPVSALHGDNVVTRSERSPWYVGPTVLGALEAAPAAAWATDGGRGARLPVQGVLRHPGGGRSYTGMVSGGALRPGDAVVVLPSGQTSCVTAVETFDGPLAVARTPLSVTVKLADDLDVSRGDLIAAADDPPPALREFDAVLCWFADSAVGTGDRLHLKHTTRLTPARVVSVDARLDTDSLRFEATRELRVDDVGMVRLAVGTALAVDPYRANRITGGFVVIDDQTRAIVGAGMVGAPVPAATPGP
jgi:bifunctional enzyme CysN/CysC